MKSAKEAWEQACFVPALVTREQFIAHCELRGALFERGFVGYFDADDLAVPDFRASSGCRGESTRRSSRWTSRRSMTTPTRWSS